LARGVFSGDPEVRSQAVTLWQYRLPIESCRLKAAD
jgi:hypothetical protein